MTHSRRKFLRTIGIAGFAGPVHRLAAAPCGVGPPLTADDLGALAGAAFARARLLGCSDAHVVITCSRIGAVLPQADSGCPAVVESARAGITVGVVKAGARGFARSESVPAGSMGGWENEIARLTALAAAEAWDNAKIAGRPAATSSEAPGSRNRWAAPRRTHSFDVPARAQRAFRRAVNEASKAGSAVTVRGEETFFVSTGGAYQHGHSIHVA